MPGTAARRLGLSLAASAAAHLALVLGVSLGLGLRTEPPTQPTSTPVQLVSAAPRPAAAPAAPPPAAGPAAPASAAPPTPPRPAPPPPPAPPPLAPPRPPRRPPPRPAAETQPGPAGFDAAPGPDAAWAGAAPPDAGPGDDAGAALAGAQTDGGPGAAAAAAPPEDPRPAAAAIDLGPFVPDGARLVAVLRTAALRGSPWAPGAEAVFAPMPDYRTILGGARLGLLDTFELVVISTPDATDVTATFLAARTSGAEEPLLAALAGDPARPAVVWRQAGAVRVGDRGPAARPVPDDDRVLVVPAPRWLVLGGPAELAPLLAPPTVDGGAPPAPAWLARLQRIAEETRDADASSAPLAVIGIADVGETFALAGSAAVPAPRRATAALFAAGDALVVQGTAVFADEGAAAAFVEIAERTRKEAVERIGTRLLLESFKARRLVESLALERHGASVWFRASVVNAEGLALLDRAASWSARFFASRRGRGQ